jgi:hypothetical protein
MSFITSTILFLIATVLFVCVSRLAYGEPLFVRQSSMAKRLLVMASASGIFAMIYVVVSSLMLPPMVSALSELLPFVPARSIDATVGSAFYLAGALAALAVAGSLIKGSVRVIDTRFCLNFGAIALGAFVLVLMSSLN